VTGWAGGRTAAQTFGPNGGDPGLEFHAYIADKVAESEPPPLLDVERYPDPRDDPEFEPAPPGWRPHTAARPAPGMRPVLAWGDLMAEPPEPPPQLHPGIPKVGFTVLAGPPKVGKTLRASQVALETRQPALLVIEEGSLRGIAYRMSRQADELGISDPPIHVMHRQRVRLDNRQSVRQLRDLVDSLRPSLVVLDPLNRLHGADENRPTQMTPVMDALSALAYDFDCAVLAIHHLAKPSAERRGDVWDRFRGAGAIRSATDANLAMDGSGERVRLVGEFRDTEPLSVWLELDREALLFNEVAPPEAPAKVDPIELRAYVEERGQVTARQVEERFEVAKHTALKALRALGCDEYEGSRRQLMFTIGRTVQ
jgi:hypothetical protein